MSTALDKALPAALDAERFVLGAILLDDRLFPQAAAAIAGDDFAAEKHRRIWQALTDLHTQGEPLDRVTLAQELLRREQLESCDGLSYLLSLEDGLPRTSNIDAYVRIVKGKANLRRLVYVGQNLSDAALLGEEGAAEIATKGMEQLLRLAANASGASRGPRDLGGYLEGTPGGINALLDPEARSKGIPTGYRKLDEMTGGMRPGELWVVAGRPAQGKTALASCIGANVALKKQSGPVALFSLEMSCESLWTRLICAEARVNQHKLRAGFLNARERQELMNATSRLSEAPLFIDDAATPTIFDIHAKARRLKAERGGLALVIVDYLQLMAMDGGRKSRVYENRVQEVSALSRGLKLLSKELEAPIIALSQLSRRVEDRQDKQPQLSDLRESGSIEQDADVVVFVFRPETYQPNRPDLRGKAEVIIGKQRNGPTGKVNLTFINDYTRFENPAGETGAPEPQPGDLYDGNGEDD